MIKLDRTRIVVWGGVVVAAAATALTVLADDAPEAPLAQAATPPPPPPPPVAAPPPEPAAAAPVVSTEGLILYGISGGGSAGMAALIGPASGYPRIVPLGKEYRPGLALKTIGASHAVLVSGGQEIALHLGGGSGAAKLAADAPSVASAPPRTAPQTSFQGMDATALRLGMKPRREDGRITGFELKQSRDLAILQQAGLRPGDVIVAVNGQTFVSEEKLLELPQEIAGSYTAEFEIERSGQRMKLSLPINQNPQ